MQKNRKKPLDVARRVDFGAPAKFASNVVTSRTLPHSIDGAKGAGVDGAKGAVREGKGARPKGASRAGLSERLATRRFVYGPSLVALVVVGCQSKAPIAKPEASRFEIPVDHEPGAGATELSATGPSTPPTRSSPIPEASAAMSALPRELPTAFARKQTCAQATCSLLRWLPEPSYALTPLEEISAQAAIWVHGIQLGAKLSVPANDALEFVVVGLRGELRVHDTRSGGSAPNELKVDRWTALRASGAGVELECAVGDCQAMLALIAPNSTLDAEAGGTPASVTFANEPRRIPLELRSFEKTTLLSWQHGKNHARILFGGSEAGTPPFSLTLLQSFAPARIPTHTHESSWEHLLVLEGRGDLELRGRSYAIEGGESLHIGPSVRHGYVANGQEPFVALQIYTPAGPEQRFLAAAGARAPSRTPPRDDAPAATVPR